MSHHHVISPSELSGWISNWGYLGIFFCVFIGNLGIPVPEETVLLVAGFVAGRGDLALRIVYLVGVGSAVTGDCCGFLFGRTSGQRLFETLADRYNFVRKRYDRLQEFFKVHGPKAVFMARFVAGARFLAGPMAGAARMSFWRFLGWNVLGALVWCPLVVTIGYLLGDELESAARIFHVAGQWIGLGVILTLIGAWLLWRERHQHGSQT
jgi:membrane protein DedA with SNARE-associated domain